MTFTSFAYAGFLVAVVTLNWLLPVRWRPPLLLAASIAFYASWTITGTATLVLCAGTTWFVGLRIAGAADRARVGWTAVGVIAAVGPLTVFKVQEAVTPHGGLALGSVAERFVVPVGLSFFAFQAVSYLVDIYRHDLVPSRSVVDVATYLAFFPHLLAGPIVRAQKLIPAFHSTPRRPNRVQWAEAGELVLVGVFKKVVLADPLIGLVTPVLANPAGQATPSVWVAIATLLLAAYFDITAYIDIARGSAKFLGIDMQRNSLTALTASSSFADFWRRWQLTLMTWFRDYIYRPIRGDGKSSFRETAGLVATFLILGWWHGLAPRWWVWGGVLAATIVIERQVQTARAARRRAQLVAARRAHDRSLLPRPPSRPARLAITLTLVALSLPLAAASSLSAAGTIYRGAFGWRSGPMAWDLVIQVGLVVGALLLVDGRERRREALAGNPDPVTPARAGAFGLMVAAVVIYGGSAARTFLYVGL